MYFRCLQCSTTILKKLRRSLLHIKLNAGNVCNFNAILNVNCFFETFATLRLSYLLVKRSHFGSEPPGILNTSMLEASVFPKSSTARINATQFDVVNTESHEVWKRIKKNIFVCTTLALLPFVHNDSLLLLSIELTKYSKTWIIVKCSLH